MQKTTQKCLKPWHIGTHLIGTWQGLEGFQRTLRPCALDKVASALEGLRVPQEIVAFINKTFYNNFK